MSREPVTLRHTHVTANEATHRAALAWPVAIGLLATGVALLFAFNASGLIDDDAYIFLRYAEHLASGQGLAFNPGEPSAGVTSILWVLLLALARRMTGADMITIAQTLGALGFGGGLALMTRALDVDAQPRSVGRVAGGIAALSPVFICQAVSGMEVGLNMLLVALALTASSTRTASSTLTAGLAFVTRPDNLLVAPLVVALRRTHRVRAALTVSVCIAALGAPWAAYCYHVGGSPLPPTRVGKLLVFLPAWYGVTAGAFANLPLGARIALAGRALARVGRMFTEGQARALLIWLPLLPFGLARAGRRASAALLLFGLSATAYAGFFPLIKLRYFAHLLPWFVAVGLIGLARLVPPRRQHALFVALIAGHLALCARALPRYREWVVCEGTKTLAGEWLANHTAPAAHLALEPIGAIGYHSQRYVIDLGGLISGDVRPVIRNGSDFDPNELLDYLHARRADYLIDQVDGPWAGRLRRSLPDSLQLAATVAGAPGCGTIGVYAVRP